ncbi:uncharacterized protein H6S33_006858 [Morchella sextelata]|uniref:uncharacterized protein n=1 Tax=Morchella sextelata TaxID=1174677 RepID=UPI001D040EAF|nr:uncharacterized protein H6S33_006858 [Morchella sextelata]KAH0604481.1 hypothetical protein H6S33_006858 [Morchella sextelata]
MVARDTYRWALIKHATTNPAFVAVAFPMPYSKYVLRNDKGPERNLKSYRSKAPLSTTTTASSPTTTPTASSAPSQNPSPLKKEVIYTAAELEPPAPIVVKPTKTARTVRWVVDDEPYEALPTPPPPPPPQQQRRKGGRREHQTQTPCRSQYTPVRGVSMWFTAV